MLSDGTWGRGKPELGRVLKVGMVHFSWIPKPLVIQVKPWMLDIWGSQPIFEVYLNSIAKIQHVLHELHVSCQEV